MAFSSGKKSVSLEDILEQTTEVNIAARYLNIIEIPCVIHSPLRTDNKPSFGIYTFDGKVRYNDFATGEKGGLFDLLSQMWQIPYNEVLDKIAEDFLSHKDNKEITTKEVSGSTRTILKEKEKSKIEIKVRDWREHDIQYWDSFGVSLEWLKYADVYPISHKIITRGNKRYVFGADKYAYAYIEKKEGNISIKIYQPFNKKGFKWCTSTDSSVISLWTKVPKEGERICICSSLKDALCLWSNTGIPCLATQGEGYTMSNTAINELKKRFKHIYILFDCDEAGLIDGEKLSKQTGFTNIVLPKFNGGKDISDLYHSLKNKQKFKEIILSLFNKF
jgi:hypothetical protein